MNKPDKKDRLLAAVPDDKLRFLHAFLDELGQDIAIRLIENSQKTGAPEAQKMTSEQYKTLLQEYFTDSESNDDRVRGIESIVQTNRSVPIADIEDEVYHAIEHLQIPTEEKRRVVAFLSVLTPLKETTAQHEEATAPEMVQIVKKKFAGDLLSKRRAWYDDNIPDVRLRMKIASSELEYAMGLRGLSSGPSAMDSGLQIKNVFDRLFLHAEYAGAGFNAAQIEESFANLQKISAAKSHAAGVGTVQ